MTSIENIYSNNYSDEINLENLIKFNKVIHSHKDTKKVDSFQQVPLTYATLFRKGEFELLEKMNISLSSVLHGEQSYEYFSPLQSNQKINYITELISKNEKKGGKLIVLIFKTNVIDEKTKELCIVCESTILVRG